MWSRLLRLPRKCFTLWWFRRFDFIYNSSPSILEAQLIFLGKTSMCLHRAAWQVYCHSRWDLLIAECTCKHVEPSQWLPFEPCLFFFCSSLKKVNSSSVFLSKQLGLQTAPCPPQNTFGHEPLRNHTKLPYQGNTFQLELIGTQKHNKFPLALFLTQ